MSFIEENHIKHIVISRIDAIGDVVLTLPTCIYLKALYPDIHITFFGNTYTKPVVDACNAVDEFINFDDFKALTDEQRVVFFKEKHIDALVHVFPSVIIARAAKKAGISIRIGTTSRNHHFFTCNKLVRLSRTNSDLHEAQQSIYLLKELGVKHVPTIGTIANYYNYSYKPLTELPVNFKNQLKNDKFNLIVHSKSNGHGKEWDLDNFTQLIKELPAEKFRIFITGSQKEHELFKEWMPQLPKHVIDTSGNMSVDELMAFIYNADGLLASGTGPLHLAAASGIHALGLFPTTRGINAGRWAPLGKKAEHIESDSDDLSSISVKIVYDRLMAWLK